MVKSIFETTLDHVLRYEGGFSDHPDDPGGRTQKGITQKTFDAWRKSIGRSTADVADIQESELRQIYRVNYWEAVRGDELPPALAVLMMDAAVNSGPGRAIETLQKSLRGLGQKIRVDRQLGPNTLSALRGVDEERLIDEFVVRRGQFYGLLETFRTFGLGWARRLVAGARLSHAILDRQRASSSEPEDEEAGEGQNQTDAGSQVPAVITSPVSLRRYFFDDLGVQTYGSFFRLWGGWATARHVIEAMKFRAPHFAEGELRMGDENLDAALIGAELPTQAPAEPVRGQKVFCMGYPAGSSTPSVRRAVVHLRRPGEPFWVARIVAPSEPVVVGMSGGIVFSEQGRQPIGIIVHRNSPADLDGDDAPDQSFDFVSLADVHGAMKSAPAGSAGGQSV